MIVLLTRWLSKVPRLAVLVLTCALVLPGALAFPATQAAPAAHTAQATNLPDGSLIRDTSTGRVYLIWSGIRHWIDSQAAFNILGYNGQAVVDLDPSVVATIPNGTELSVSYVANGMVWPLAPIVANPVHLDMNGPSATPGSVIHIDGSGFLGGEQVTLTAPNNVTITASTGASGTFAIDVPIIGNVSYGLHHIYAQGTQSGLFGVQVFHVIPPAPSPTVAVSPSSVPQGQSISVSGGGFSPGETVQIFLAGGASTTAATADANGAFGPVSLSVLGTLSTGSHPVRVYGTGSFHYAATSVSVVTAQQPTATATPTPSPTATPVVNPSVTVNPTSISAGAQIVVSGSGFLPGEIVLIRFNGVLQTGVNASAAGNFSGVLISVPVGTPSGIYSVVATGATSGRSAGAPLAVQVPQPTAPPAIAISPTSTQAGAQVRVAGTGFQPGETLLVSFNNTVMQSLTADGTGSFTNGSFVVPANLSPGQYGVSVLGAVSGRAANAILTIVPAPAIPVARLFVSPTSVSPGGHLNLAGSGFAARETVLVRVDGALALALSTDATGSFSAGFTVRLGFGQHTLTVSGASSGRSASVTFRVAQPVTPGIGLVPSRTHRGSVVAVNGNNFLAFEIVLIRFRGSLVQAVQADANGRFFNARFTVPGNAPYGLSTITITGARSGRSASARLDVTPAPAAGPRIRLSARTVHHNGVETVSGSGYFAAEIVLIRFRGALVQAATADSHGNFSRASFHIPVNSPFGKQTITVTGARSGRSARATVNVTPALPSTSVNVSPRIVKQNGVVTVTGRGFQAGEIVLIRLRGVLVQAATADRHGNFRTSFRVPGGRFKGADVVLVTGARSNRHAQSTLVVI